MLAASADVTLAGTALLKVNNTPGGSNDVLASLAGSMAYGGTLQLSNMTANAFTNGQSLQLFSAYGYSGSFTNLVLPVLAMGLEWNTNLLTVNGTVSVWSGAPRFTFFSVSGTNLVFSGTNGIPNGTYVVLTSTNLTQPWTPVATNPFNSLGDFTFDEPISTTNQQQFFSIQEP
jgi:hypothetical protein